MSNFENSAYSKIYSLKTGKYIKNIEHTNLNNTYYITSWKDVLNNYAYEIEC